MRKSVASVVGDSRALYEVKTCNSLTFSLHTLLSCNSLTPAPYIQCLLVLLVLPSLDKINVPQMLIFSINHG